MVNIRKIDFRQPKWRLIAISSALIVIVVVSVWLNLGSLRSDFEISDVLGGNIFPSSILSVATTDVQVILPSDTLYVGNPKS